MTAAEDLDVLPDSGSFGLSIEEVGVPRAVDANITENCPDMPQPKSHPLGPLTAQEISQSAGLVRGSWPDTVDCHFKVVTLLEPPKLELAPYLAAERVGQTPTSIDRRAFVVYYFRGTVSGRQSGSSISHADSASFQHNLHEAVVNLTTSKIEVNVKLGPFTHANGDGEEIVAVENALLAHPDVQAEIAKLELPQGSVIVADPWIYGKKT